MSAEQATPEARDTHVKPRQIAGLLHAGCTPGMHQQAADGTTNSSMHLLIVNT